jgi:hypothetical protein
LQLGQLGLNAEFLPCEIQVKDSEWEGIRRKYWHGRDTYYLPRVTWKPEALTRNNDLNSIERNDKKNAASSEHQGGDAKRQKVDYKSPN